VNVVHNTFTDAPITIDSSTLKFFFDDPADALNIAPAGR
jgi:hypothetical protein